MSKFTAADARVLAGPSVEDHVDDALILIKSAAEKKQHTTSLTSSFWVTDGYGRTEKYKKACKQLEELGFKVDFFYQENQFVTMYTVVEW